MGLKLLSAFITFAIDTVVAIIVLFMMLIAMNGYSESDATAGLGTYLVLALLGSLGMALAAFFLSGKLLSRGTRPAFAVLISTPISSIAGMILIVVSSVVGIAVSEYIRVNY
jgi:hypothetical protein